MKKMLNCVVAIALVLSMFTVVALAETNPFGSKVITCAAGAEIKLNNNLGGIKDTNAGRLYVRHYLWGDWGEAHTNYFRASLGVEKPLYGGNWMMPDTANFVRSSALALRNNMNAWGRGNTDYAYSRIEISGYSDEDA